jgi:hypothetical protein
MRASEIVTTPGHPVLAPAPRGVRVAARVHRSIAPRSMTRRGAGYGNVTADRESVESYEPTLAEMCEDFDRFWAQPQLNPDWQIARTRLNFALVYGLACHAKTMIAESLALFREPTLAMVPITRSVYEAGVTAQWLRQVPDADIALMRESRRLQAALTTTMIASANPEYQESGRIRSEQQEPPIPVGQGPNSAGFEQICNTFGPGQELYLYYRMLCGPVHAGVQAADVWLGEDSVMGFRARRQPRFGFTHEAGWLAAWGLALAHRALDELIIDSPRADFLDRIEREEQMTTRLPLA